MKKKLWILCLGLSMGLAACGGKVGTLEVSSVQQESRAEESNSVAQPGAEGGNSVAQSGAEGGNSVAQPGTEQTGAAQQKDLLEQFLSGDTAAEIDGDFVDLTQTFELDYSAGSSYTLNQLIGQLRKLDEYGMLGSKEPVITYAMLQNRPGEDDDERGMAVAVDFENNYETNRFLYVLKEDEGELEITLAIDGWTRRWATLNPYGVVYEGGSGGAGYHGGMTYVPDEFEYRELEQWAEVYPGFTFYLYEGEELDKVNAIITECFEMAAENEKLYEVMFTQNKIGDRVYYTYYVEDETLKQQVEDLAKKHDFRFDPEADVDAARADRAKLLEAESIYQNYDEVTWTQR